MKYAKWKHFDNFHLYKKDNDRAVLFLLDGQFHWYTFVEPKCDIIATGQADIWATAVWQAKRSLIRNKVRG